MSAVGFRGVAATPHRLGDEHVSPAALSLPRAVLVHFTHRSGQRPVAVAVPRRLGDAVAVEAVFASDAGAAAELAGKRLLRGLSVNFHPRWWRERRHGKELGSGVLVAVDLVPLQADPRAVVTEVLHELSDEQAEVRDAFDAYLADPANPWAIDLTNRVAERGLAAFEPLERVAAPLLGRERVPA